MHQEKCDQPAREHKVQRTRALAAAEQLGASVAVYLEAGQSPGGVASTIVDVTGPLRLVRAGAISLAELRRVADVLDLDAPRDGVDAP